MKKLTKKEKYNLRRHLASDIVRNLSIIDKQILNKYNEIDVLVVEDDILIKVKRSCNKMIKDLKKEFKNDN